MKKFEAMADNLGKKVQAAIQTQVSGTRTRYKDEGFDLDLTYITPRLIAMSFPGEGMKGLVRNDIDDVAAFFNAHHPGHYRIWNLAEQTYDYSKFDDHVVEYSFPDHQTAPLDLLVRIVESIDQWLAQDTTNVAAVHCLAGKGRTGCVCCAYLMYTGEKLFPDEAMAYFLEKRKQGVESPSQKRYLGYLKQILLGPRHLKLPVANIVHLRDVIVRGIPKNDVRLVSLCAKQYEAETVDGSTRARGRLLYTSTNVGSRVVAHADGLKATLDIVLEGDIILQVFHTGLVNDVAVMVGAAASELACLNFHTAFLEDLSIPMQFRKGDLNVAFRHPKLGADFCVELRFEGCPDAPFSRPGSSSSSHRRPSIPMDAPTVVAVAGQSEAEPHTDDGREAGKDCAVCFESGRSARLPCGHCTLCARCVRKVQAKFGRCPVCEAPFTSWEGHDVEPDSTFIRKH